MRQVDRIAIGARLAHVRASTAQRQYADDIGVPFRTYQNYEQGLREPDLRTVLAVMDRGWSPVWLLTGEGPERLNQVASGAGSQDVSGEALMIATELAEEAVRRQGGFLPKPRFFELVALIYDGVTQGLPYAEILDFAQPSAGKQAQERDDGERGQGVDESGAGGAERSTAGPAKRRG